MEELLMHDLLMEIVPAMRCSSQKRGPNARSPLQPQSMPSEET
jgi:hypothetical protein